MSDTCILIIGSSGAIGSNLINYFAQRNYNVHGTYYKSSSSVADSNYHFLDLYSSDSILMCLNAVKPDKIIYVAGCKDLAKCESKPLMALDVNALCIKKIALALQSLNLDPLFVYLSTDYVFSGERGGYTISDSCHPSTIYGFSKLVGENLSQKLFRNCYVMRTSAVMTPDHGFFGWLNNSIDERKEIEAYSNVYFSPTPIRYLCDSVLNLICSDDQPPLSTTVHCSSNVSISRYDFIVNYTLFRSPDHSVSIKPKVIDFSDTLFKPDLSICDSTKDRLDDQTFLDYSMFLP